MASHPPATTKTTNPFSIGTDDNGQAQVLIVDDDDCIRELIGEMLTASGMLTRAFANPLDALAHVETAFYNVILLDISMPQLSGLELLPKMKNVSPASKFIMVTGCAKKENAVEAFRRGAFDFLEKPVSIELLSHAVERALKVQETEFRLMETLGQLEKINAAVTTNKNNEEQTEQWLVDTNRALSILAQNLETSRLDSEKHVAEATRKLALPIVRKLVQDKAVFSRYPRELDLLMLYVHDMTQNSTSDRKIATLLSQTELQVAFLIRLGMSTREIAEYLVVSPYTVKTHRRNIRKKLRIRNSKCNLKSYLTRESEDLQTTSMSRD